MRNAQVPPTDRVCQTPDPEFGSPDSAWPALPTYDHPLCRTSRGRSSLARAPLQASLCRYLAGNEAAFSGHLTVFHFTACQLNSARLCQISIAGPRACRASRPAPRLCGKGRWRGGAGASCVHVAPRPLEKQPRANGRVTEEIGRVWSVGSPSSARRVRVGNVKNGRRVGTRGRGRGSVPVSPRVGVPAPSTSAHGCAWTWAFTGVTEVRRGHAGGPEPT